MHGRGPSRVASALFVLNRASGTGRTSEEIEGCRRAFHSDFSAIPNRSFRVTDSHAEVSRLTRDFFGAVPGPSFLLAGGGGGTTRALIQGVLSTSERGTRSLEDAWIGTLRLGSGNVLAKKLALPPDSLAGMRALSEGLMAGATHPCWAYCCTLHRPGAGMRREYGIALAGLGHFGSVPAEVCRWKTAHLRLVRRMSRRVGLEAINDTAYRLFSLREALRCLLRPRQTDLIEIRCAGHSERLRLLAGVVLNFDIPQIPLPAGCAIGEPRLTLCLVPYEGRRPLLQTLLAWRDLDRRVKKYTIRPEDPAEILFLDRSETLVELDEDTFRASSRLRFEVVGPLRVVAPAPSGGHHDEPVHQHHRN